jgi:transaldolase
MKLAELSCLAVVCREAGEESQQIRRGYPMNPLKQLEQFGQSFWIDSISRHLIAYGGLARLIAEDGLKGLTSNPAIFEQAIVQGREYAAAIRQALKEGDPSPEELYEALAIADIRDAADLLRPVFEATGGRDGYVSLEVSPRLAHDTRATVEEAQRLWRQVDRPNLMLKVPATPAGLPAIEHLIADGINVNVTLLFSRAVYRKVAEAYMAGLEKRAAADLALEPVASVASFFVSRIDTAVDELIEERLGATPPDAQRSQLERLRGRAAIANAKLAYQAYKSLVASERWRRLAARGARTQRLLWGSTSTKNPAYRDVIYVEELIGPDTVNTMPLATIDAFRDHGRPRASLEEGVEEARCVLEELAEVGIVLEEVADRLLADGVRRFAEAFDRLLTAVSRARHVA